MVVLHTRGGVQTYHRKPTKYVSFADEEDEEVNSGTAMLLNGPNEDAIQGMFWHPTWDAVAAASEAPTAFWNSCKEKEEEDSFEYDCSKNENKCCKCLPNKTENSCQRCYVGCEQEDPFKKATTVTEEHRGFPSAPEKKQKLAPCRCIDDYICRRCAEKKECGTKAAEVTNEERQANTVVSPFDMSSWTTPEQHSPLRGRNIMDDPMCFTSPPPVQRATAAPKCQELTTPIPICTPWLEDLNRPPRYRTPTFMQLIGLRKVLFAPDRSNPFITRPTTRTVLGGKTVERSSYPGEIPILYHI